MSRQRPARRSNRVPAHPGQGSFGGDLADIPKWFDGPCGVSKYPNAGDMTLPPLAADHLGIVNGIEAKPHEFPWQVTVVIQISEGEIFCGGSIISSEWILTAGHCAAVSNDPRDYSVQVGAHQLSAPDKSSRVMKVSKVILHEKFNATQIPFYVVNDIGLLKLSDKIEFNEDVQPICAPDSEDTYAWKKSVTSGFGITAALGQLADILRYVTLNVTTNKYCLDSFGSGDPVFNDSICAVGNHDNTDHRGGCSGDSGGPLAVKDKKSIFSLIGITSWGVGSCDQKPSVYTRVGYFNQWITSKLCSN